MVLSEHPLGICGAILVSLSWVRAKEHAKLIYSLCIIIIMSTRGLHNLFSRGSHCVPICPPRQCRPGSSGLTSPAAYFLKKVVYSLHLR
jgi:hypothetical protein